MQSLSEKINSTVQAFLEQFPPRPIEQAPSMGMYVDEIFEDHLIICEGDKHYQVGYKVNDDGYNFQPREKWLEVVEEYVPAPKAEDKSAATPGNFLKSISKTPAEMRVANYIVLFGGRDLEGVASESKNADGTRGEFFSDTVQVESPYTKANQVYMDWEHGRDPDGLGIGRDAVLGYVDWKSAKRDERGIFVERVLDRRNKYMQFLEDLIDAGLIGTSSESTGNVEKAANGEIKRWPIRRDSLTVMPMEPRMMTENPLIAKAIEGIKSLSSIPSEVAIANNGEEISIEKSLQGELAMNEEIKTMLEGFKTEMVATVTDAAKGAVDAAMKALPELKGGANIQITSDPADRPFESIAEQAKAIKSFTMSTGRTVHPRLKALENIQAKAALGLNETTPSEGGFMLEPTLSAQFLKPIHEEGPFSADVQKLPVGPNSNYGWLNGIDETSRVNGSRWGGVRAYHRNEAASITATAPKFRQVNWKLDAIEALMYVTDEQLNDAAMTDVIMRESALEEISFIVNNDIYEGDGVGKATGFMNSPALIQVARATLLLIAHADILSMWERVNSRNKSKGKWYVSSTAYTQLMQISFTSGSTGILSPYVAYGADGKLVIMGRPVVETEHNAALGTLGDLVFADLKEYLFWEKDGVKTSVNPWLQWLTSEQAFKFTYRCDGKTALHSALTPFKGTSTVSPFVALKASTS